MSSAYNIKNIRQLYNLTQEELALALGLTRELINKMEKGKLPVSKGTASLLQRFMQERQSENFSHDVEYLGSSVAIPAEQSFVPYFLQRREQKNEPLTRLVPLVAQKAHAGYAKSYDQVDYLNTLEKFSLPPGVNPTGAVWSYFEVDGDSMEPTLNSGDILLSSMLPAEDWDDIKNYCVYVILANDQLVVKRVFQKNTKQWILISDNEEAYPQATLMVADIKQVWTFRRHIRSRVPPPKEFVIHN